MNIQTDKHHNNEDNNYTLNEGKVCPIFAHMLYYEPYMLHILGMKSGYNIQFEFLTIMNYWGKFRIF